MNNELEKSTVIKVYIRLHYITFDYQMLHLFTHSVNISNVIISNWNIELYLYLLSNIYEMAHWKIEFTFQIDLDRFETEINNTIHETDWIFNIIDTSLIV